MNKFILGSVLLFFINVTICSQTLVTNGWETISRTDLLSTVEFLTSGIADGRLPGSKGYDAAAVYMADKFSNLGLLPFGEEGYFQYFSIEYNRIDTPAVFNLHYNKNITKYRHGEDFVYRGFTGSGCLLMPLTFCGYGISDTSSGYDDYANIDVKDKIVMVFKQNPGWQKDGKSINGLLPREKSLIAKKHGAKGILFVSLPNDENPQPLIGSVMHGSGEQPEDFPQLHISIKAADDLLANTGFNISDLQTRIDETQRPFSFNLFTKAEIVANAVYDKNATTMNVIGLLEGTDPELKNEFLIIGAHLDHVGRQAGLLFPGANDNASGSAAVLEVAEAFVRSGISPKRSVLFVLFAGEEQGLYGSTYFADNMKLNNDNVIAMLNIDCIGYGDSIKAGNGKSAPKLWNIVRETDSRFIGMMVEQTWAGGGADATPFHNKGIPSLYFVTTNSYDHLHLPSDKPETLNPELFERTVKLIYLTARSIADGNYPGEKIFSD
ncbi:MAG: hypothetical protein Kow0098_04400 [Ignavibacteriaceae bacterium]